VVRELEVRHMVIPYWVMKNELVVTLPPIITNLIFFVDNERFNIGHFETGCGAEPSLSSTLANNVNTPTFKWSN
jgi:hypothetical protein